MTEATIRNATPTALSRLAGWAVGDRITRNRIIYELEERVDRGWVVIRVYPNRPQQRDHRHLREWDDLEDGFTNLTKPSNRGEPPTSL